MNSGVIFWKNIKLIVSDFDGVMTNNHVWIDETGKETVCVSRADGQGINMLRSLGIDLVIMSTETNRVVEKRAAKLKVRCIQSVSNKVECLQKYCNDNELSTKNIAYIGNDINDYDAMKIAGIVIVPDDACDAVKKIADYITKAKGGHGVIREVFEIINKDVRDGKK